MTPEEAIDMAAALWQPKKDDQGKIVDYSAPDVHDIAAALMTTAAKAREEEREAIRYAIMALRLPDDHTAQDVFDAVFAAIRARAEEERK